MRELTVADLLLCLHPQRETRAKAPRHSRVPELSWQRLSSPDEPEPSFALWAQPLEASPEGWRGYELLCSSTRSWQRWLLCDWIPQRDREREAAHADEAEVQTPTVPSNGQFLLLAHHRPSGRFYVATDRFGTLHAYVAVDQRDGSLVLGTYHPAVAHYLAPDGRALDALGLASFACFGFYLGERTGHADVQVLRPGRLYALQTEPPRATELARTHEWRYEPEYRRDVPDTLAALDETLQRTVEEQVAGIPAGRVALPLSGGLDSRMLLAALTRSDADPYAAQPGAAAERLWCYAYDYAGMRLETDIARRLAARRQAAFEAYTVEPYLFAKLPGLSPALEGAQDLTQCRQAAVLDELRAHAEVVVAGHWGDVWFDDAGLLGGASGRRNGGNNRRHAGQGDVAPSPVDDAGLARHLMKKALKPGYEWLLEHLVRPLVRETYGAEVEPLALLEEAMQQEVARIPALPDADARIKAVKTETWSFRWTLASLRCYRLASRLRLPFYDSRLADFLATVPSEWMHGRALQIAYLKQTAPELAAVPWQAADASLFAHPRPRWQRLLRGGWRRARRRLTNQAPVQRNWEVQLLPALGRDRLADSLLGTPNNRLHDLVAAPRIRELLGHFHAAPRREAAHAVTMLLTLNDWLATHA